MYCQDTRALLFRGINSSSITISDSQVSVQEFIKNTRSLTGGKLFTEVSDAINGSMVLVMDASKYSEAYQWLSKGLVQIAQHIEHSKFTTIFTRPNWVEQYVVQSVGTAPLQAIPQHDELQDNLLLSPLSLSHHLPYRVAILREFHPLHAKSVHCLTVSMMMQLIT